MKVVLFREHGGPEKLLYEELPMPRIDPQDVVDSGQSLRAEPSRHLGQTGESCLCHSPCIQELMVSQTFFGKIVLVC